MTWTKRRIALATVAYLLLFGMQRAEWLLWRLEMAIEGLLPPLTAVLPTLVRFAEIFLESAYPPLVLLGTLFGGAIAVMRIARRAAPGSTRDPLVQLRDALRAHPRLVATLPWAPSAFWLYAVMTRAMGHGDDERRICFALGAVTTAAIVKLALRALDRVENHEAAPPPQVASDETVFRAVAVTPRAQAMVGGVLGLAVAMVAFMSNVNLAAHSGSSVGLLVLAYATILGATARWYQAASTIHVGTDGVFVQGTSKTRFYSYRAFDSVRASGATLHLLRGGRTIVRLQLHGADVERGAFLAERIETALAAAKNVSGAESLVAHGGNALAGGDYRNASLSREQLWELIEADGTAGEARAAAAKMLAPTLDAGDRGRLRVAAAHTADPKVRITLEAFADPDDEAPHLTASPAARLTTREIP